MSADAVAVLYVLMNNADAQTFFTSVATFYDHAAASNRAIHRRDVAESCEVARDGARAVVSALSEIDEANARECERLLGQLRESLTLPRRGVA